MCLRSLLLGLTLLVSPQLYAESEIKPFISADSETGSLLQATDSIRAKLIEAGFQPIGEYSPYPTASIIIFTHSILKNAATNSIRGGYGGALRASVTEIDGEIQVSYTNPVYWSSAYRMEDDLTPVGEMLATSLGNQGQFGTGKLNLTPSDMREYHYTMFMEYFDDPSNLVEYANHQQAVSAVEAGLAAGAGGSQKVFRLDLGKDPAGKQMVLFGVALNGDGEQCSGDQYIMDKIDKESPRHTAHLPYEMLVYGSEVEALYARFRIAISWPHLPMIASDTGATFFSIMCAPGAIERALTLAAGGELRKKAENKNNR
jgi:hypothetical protein